MKPVQVQNIHPVIKLPTGKKKHFQMNIREFRIMPQKMSSIKNFKITRHAEKQEV